MEQQQKPEHSERKEPEVLVCDSTELSLQDITEIQKQDRIQKRKDEKELKGWLERQRAHREWLVETGYKKAESFDKGIMTLAGGALGISITFVKTFAGDHPTYIGFLWFGWIFLIASLLSILWSLLTASDANEISIAQVDKRIAHRRKTGLILKEDPGLEKTQLTDKLNRSAMLSFVIGVALLVVFSGLNIENEKSKEEKKPVENSKPNDPMH